MRGDAPATVRIMSPSAPERTVALAAHNTFGRLQDNTIQILDGNVSKHHCHIDAAGGRFILKDLGSRNGTHVNGERVRSERALSPGDEIKLGATTLVFEAATGWEDALGESPSAFTIGCVTIAPGVGQSHVLAALAQEADQNFETERLVTDAATLRRDYEKLRISFELTRAIAGELDVDRLLERILGAAFEFLPADRGVVLLLDEAGRPQPRCVRTKRGDSGEVRLSSTIVDAVLRDRTALLSTDATMDARFKTSQ